MQIWHHVLSPDPLTYTIAKALSHGGLETMVFVTRSAQAGRLPGRMEMRVSQIPGVTVISSDGAKLPRVIDHLIVQAFPRPAESLQNVARLAGRARRIALITAGDRSQSLRGALKSQWLEARRLGLSLRRVDRLLYKDGYHPRDLLGFVAPRHAVGFDVHSQFLDDPGLFRAIHARDWDPQSRRPILANFLGSQDPQTRKRVLDSIRELCGPQAANPLSLPKGKTLLWHEYFDDAPAPLAPAEFVRTLSNSDFTLCPRGYSVVTHRPIEALLRGSIPVLSAGELDLYGFPLDDGRNCIAVPDGRWPETMQRIARFEESEFVRMRGNIGAMFETDLSYDVVSKRIRSRVGADDDR